MNNRTQRQAEVAPKTTIDVSNVSAENSRLIVPDPSRNFILAESRTEAVVRPRNCFLRGGMEERNLHRNAGLHST